MVAQPSGQFESIISDNFSKCPGCDKNYVTDSSPVSEIDNETKVCGSCSAGEAARSAISGTDATSIVNNQGSMDDLIDTYQVARGVEKAQGTARFQSENYASRIRNAKIPVPEPTTVGKWKIRYSKNPHNGRLEADAESPEGTSHAAILDHDTGTVRFGHYDTYIPPKHIQQHITKVLTNHYKKHAGGNSGN